MITISYWMAQQKNLRLQLGIAVDSKDFVPSNMKRDLSSSQFIRSCIIMKHYCAESSVQ
jgi:hypothetical protein